MRRLFILGHPTEYGGAGSELRMQIQLWIKAFPEIKLYIIPTQIGYQMEPLYQEMLDLGITYEAPMDFTGILEDDALINFCSDQFLENLELINRFTKRIVWVNCMTYLFNKEKDKAHKNLIAHYLYQRDTVRDENSHKLKKLGANANFQTFLPYFHEDGWKYSVKDQEKTNIGRISRQDADKYAANTLHIYEYITSPKWKQGHFLGWAERSEIKVGKPPTWVRTYPTHKEFPVKEFYNTVDFIVQPTDTFENLPRIGFEAMHTGTPLIVDNRGGWQHMIEHGVSGFLCNTAKEFIYWGTRLAFEPELLNTIALNAKARAKELSSYESSKESWADVFEKVYQ